MVQYSNRCPDMAINHFRSAPRAGRYINAALVPAGKIE